MTKTRLQPRQGARTEGILRVGLVNALPTAAQEAASRQFREALEAQGAVELCAFSLKDPSRVGRPPGREDAQRLVETKLDALIVTGAEPLSDAIADEPLYPFFAALAEAALASRLPVVWSCLAAHAAAHRLTGLERRRLPDKLSGVFTLETLDPSLGAGLRPALSPHSRWNELSLSGLREAGFHILAAGGACGADAFTLPGAESLLFLQGHPEYHAETLLLEYRRDLNRAMKDPDRPFPSPPVGLLDGAREAALEKLRPGSGTSDREGAARESLIALKGLGTLSRPWLGWRDRVFGAWLAEARRGIEGQARSNTAAMPWPPPMHMVSRP